MANSNPPPKAKPLMAAIIGVPKFSAKSNKSSCPSRDNCAASETLKSVNSLISAPATNALSPLPVNTMTRTFWSWSKAFKAWCNSKIVALLRALSFLGRLMVNIPIPASSCRFKLLNIIRLLVFWKRDFKKRTFS